MFTPETAQRAVERRRELEAEAQGILDAFEASGGDLAKALQPHLPKAMAQLVGQMNNRDPKVSQPALRMLISLVQATKGDDDVAGVVYVTAFKPRREFDPDAEQQPCPCCGRL